MYSGRGKILVKYIHLIIFFFLYVQLPGQTNDQQYSHHTYTVNDGLSNNSVFRIAQDSFGFIWLATWDGLTRFDGFKFKNFRHDPNDPTTLPYFWPYAVCADGLRNLWVTTQTISRFDPDSEQFTIYGPDSRYYCSSKQIYSSTYDNHGRFFIFGTKGISIYDSGRDSFDDIQTIFQLKSKRNSHGGMLLVDNQYFWIVDYTNSQILFGKLDSTQTGDPRIIFNRTLLFPFPPVKSGNFVHEVNIHRTPKGNYFIASNLGLYYMDMDRNDVKRIFNVQDSLIQSLDHDMVWSSVDEGIFLYKNRSKTIIHFPKSFTNRVNNAFLDKGGNIWYGSQSEGGAGTGLNQIVFQETPWKHYSLNFNKSKATVSVFALFEDKNTTDLFIGTSNFRQLLKLRNDDRIEVVDLPFVADGIVPRSISQDLSGSLWVGTREGYLFKSDIHIRQFDQIYPASNDLPMALPFHSGKLLRFLPSMGMLAGGHSGLALFDMKSNIIDKAFINNTGEGDFYSCYLDSSNRIWAGGCGELFEISEEMILRQRIKIGNGLYNIEDIVPAGDSVLWLALLGGGICCYNCKSGSQRHYSSHNGLKNNVVYCILPDRKNNLWLSTNDGLSLFNVLTKQFVNYSGNDGLNIQEFNSDACLMRKNGSMVFGGMGGIVIFNPDSIGLNDDRNNPSLVFTEIISHIESKDLIWHICDKERQTLEKGVKNLRIVFSQINFLNQHNSKFRYRVKGYKEDWDILPDGARFFDVNGLDPGSYEVIISSSGNQGQWNLETSIVILIPPYFYETLWFKFLVMFSILCLLAFIIYLKVHQLSLLQKHRIACLKQLALQQQLNPHFISNALQAIESLAGSGDELVLNEYISRIYSLMRRMMDNSGKEYVPLSEEIEMITGYLKAEQMRVGFSFQIDNRFGDQDPDMATSFIQPFLENAILHGIQARQDGAGKLTVTLTKRNRYSICCVIEDNGPGYIPSIKERPKNAGISKGIVIIKERLRIYQSLNKKMFELWITANQDIGRYPGTSVMIEIPIRKGS